MATRHHARVAVVGMLYAVEIGNAATAENPDPYLEKKKLKGKQASFAKELLGGTLQNLGGIDAAIKPHLKEWELERLGSIERAILRLGTYELLHTATDGPIIINEAVEMAKEMGDDNAPRFINGILDAVRKSRPAPAPQSESGPQESNSQ